MSLQNGTRFCPQLCDKLKTELQLKISPYAVVEAPLRIRGPVAFLGSRVGDATFESYATVGSFSSFLHSSLGRYSAVGSRVHIGLSKINENAVTTSVALFAHSPLSELVPIPEHCALGSCESCLSSAVIGHDVWIGTAVTIPADVTIGTGSIIGAGAVITHDVEPYSVVVGHNRKIRSRFSDELCADLLASQWWDYDLPRMLQRGQTPPVEDPKAFLAWLKDSDPADLLRLDAQPWIRLEARSETECHVELEV